MRLRKLQSDLDNHESNMSRPAFDELSRLFCQPLCHELVTTLPRELRNMIYSYLYTSDVVKITSRKHLCTDTHCNPHPPPPFKETSCITPHWWRVNIVGQKFLDELVELWYSRTTFLVEVENLNDLYKLLNINPWKLDQPSKPNDFINSIYLCTWTDPMWEWREYQLYDYLGKLQGALAILQVYVLRVKKPVSISLNFQMTPKFYSKKATIDSAFRAMEAVFPRLGGFRGPLHGLVNKVLICDDLTNCTLDMWKSAYVEHYDRIAKDADMAELSYEINLVGGS